MQKDKQQYKVLVVEDNPGDYYLIIDYLEEEILSPQIQHAVTFAQADQFLNDPSATFDIILLDLSLPDLEGEALLLNMLQIANNTPIIVLTGYTDVNFAKKSLALGASDYLLKDQLNATILYKSIIYNIERNKYLQDLKASEQRYADLFHLSPQPMWVVDLETFKFLDINKAAIAHYGYSREEFLSMTVNDIRPPSEIEKVKEKIAEIKNKPTFNFLGEFVHIKKNGERIITESRSNYINFKGKEAAIILSNDITALHNYIDAIEAQNENFKEIAWTQAHIMRAPVARLLGIVQLIKTGTLSAEETRYLLDNVYTSAEEIDQITREIIDKAQSIIQEE